MRFYSFPAAFSTSPGVESRGEVGQVNVSQHTYELLKNDPEFRFTSRGKVEAKGVGEVEMYFVEKVEPKES